MRIQCEKCQASYNIPDEKVQGRAFKFACKRCGNEIRYRPDEPAATGKMTTEIAASDVQPRMTGEMQAADGDKTVFAPPKQAEIRQGPQRKAKYGDDSQPSEAAKPRMTMEGKPLSSLPEKQAAAWYLAYSKTKRGPMGIDEIRDHLMEIELPGEIYVWKAGFENWKRIQETPEFANVWHKVKTAKAALASDNNAATQPIPAAPKPVRPKPEPKAEPEPIGNGHMQAAAASNKSRPTFTELLKSELGTSGDDDPLAKPKTSQKIDISDLMGKEGAPQSPAFARNARVEPGKRPVVIEEYVPAQKKKIPWVPIAILTVLFFLVIATPLTLAYKQIIHIPGLDNAPLIGHYFKVVEVDHYAALREQWEMLVKIDETKVAMQSTKEAEEQQLLEEERQKAEAEKAERRARALERSRTYAAAHPGGGGGNAAVTTFDFGDSEEEMETEGELETNEIKRMKPLAQSEVNGIIRQNMRQIATCVAQQKNVGESVTGTMSMRFTISRRGSVVRAVVTTDKFKDSYVADCVAATIERIRFPRSGGSVTVSYPFSIQ
jgi:predicted Zn finger-like uncharacterized protein